MEQVMSVIESVGGVLWGQWTPWILLGAGVLFTVWTRFTQYTAMTHGVTVVRGVYDDPDDPGAINHFQALSAALSATVGLGNIGGVALAIGIGGPGALVWMWLVGFLGMALKTIEITLAMMYRNTDNPDSPSGGAMWVVDKVIGGKGGIWKPIARAIGVFFCITLIISTFTGGNMYQAWSVAGLTELTWGWDRWFTGVAMAVLVGLVIIGGIKRIGTVAGKLVPLMCAIYVLAAFVIIAMNISEIPGLFVLIFKSAFSTTEAGGAFVGGTMGFAFMQGMKRALFSNEAGQGSAPIAHAAAKTGEPAREGIVGGIGPFIDTLCICTVTALVILSTGTWNRPALGDLQGTVTLSKSSAEGTATYNVGGPTTLASLPGDTWADGDRFFLVAEVTGGDHAEGLARIRVTGTVDRTDLIWSPVIFGGDWQSTPTALELVDSGVYKELDGANLTAYAFGTAFGSTAGLWIVTIAAWAFAISTMISWSYYGEQGMLYMLGPKSVLPYKIIFCAAAVLAAAGINDTRHMIAFMDLGTGAMLWSNIPIVLGLGYLAVRCLRDYGKKLAAGEFKRHDGK